MSPLFFCKALIKSDMKSPPCPVAFPTGGTPCCLGPPVCPILSSCLLGGSGTGFFLIGSDVFGMVLAGGGGSGGSGVPLTAKEGGGGGIKLGGASQTSGRGGGGNGKSPSSQVRGISSGGGGNSAGSGAKLVLSLSAFVGPCNAAVKTEVRL